MSFLILLVAIVVGIALSFTLVDSAPNDERLSQAAVILAAAVGVYAMVRIEEGPAPIARRLQLRE